MSCLTAGLAIVCTAGAACSASVATPTARARDAKPVRLALVSGSDVSVAVVEDGQVRVVRTFTAPGTIAQLEWVGDDPVTRLASPDGQIARITAGGYEPFAALPASTWADVQGSGDAAMSEWELVAAADGSIWQGYCGKGFPADGKMVCDGFRYARLAPSPVVVQTKPPVSVDAAQLEPVAAPAEPAVEIVRVSETQSFLRCTDAGTAVEVPAPDQRREDVGMLKPTWLSADPPIFRTAEVTSGFAAVFEDMVFERCTESRRYGSQLATGPDGLVALYGGASLIVLQHGRVLGTGPLPASLVRFAPR